MKIRKLLGGLILSTALAAGVGIFAGSHNDFVKNAQAVGTVDVYCTQTHDWANDEIIKIHQWGGSTPGTTWGWDTCTPMTYAFNNEYGQKVYKGTIPSDRTGFLFMYRQGTDLKESVNISTYSNNSGFAFTDDWPNSKNDVSTWTCYPYTINYYGNGSTSGSMNSSTAYGNVEWGLDANAFVKTGYSFAGWATSSEGSVVYANQALLPTKTNTNMVNLYAKWTKVYSAGRYIVGSFCNWNIDGAVLMDSGSEFTADVTLSYGDEFKLADYNGSTFTTYYGYSSSIGGGLFCFSQVITEDASYNNFKCWASGTYSIYSTSGEYESGKNISVEISGTKWNAEQLAAKLMSFGEWAGHCGDDDRFPICKEKYIGMESSEQTKFQGYASSSTDQFRNAYLRYTAWASALGENPWASGKQASGIITLGLGGENAGTLIIVISITAVSLAAVGGYFLFRKKKEN